jgi:hypothetical protein
MSEESSRYVDAWGELGACDNDKLCFPNKGTMERQRDPEGPRHSRSRTPWRC